MPDIPDVGNVCHTSDITEDVIQEHLIVEWEHQKKPNEPELICKDLSYLNLDNLLNNEPNEKAQNVDKEKVSSDDDIDIEEAIRRETKELGGPMLSKEENQKIRKERLRGGDFKEKSSEDSDESSKRNSPNLTRTHEQLPNPIQQAIEEKKLFNDEARAKLRKSEKHKSLN